MTFNFSTGISFSPENLRSKCVRQFSCFPSVRIEARPPLPKPRIKWSPNPTDVVISVHPIYWSFPGCMNLGFYSSGVSLYWNFRKKLDIDDKMFDAARPDPFYGFCLILSMTKSSFDSKEYLKYSWVLSSALWVEVLGTAEAIEALLDMCSSPEYSESLSSSSNLLPGYLKLTFASY